MVPTVENRSGALLEVVIVVGAEVTIRSLPQQARITFGRSKECDISIDHSSISRRHAVLHVGPQLVIEDLGSANGTTVSCSGALPESAETNSSRLGFGESFRLAIGDTILLGSAACTIRYAKHLDVAPLEIRSAGAALKSREIVRDPVMQALYDTARSAAQSSLSILILGETGVGKEVLAREIHRLSPRNKGPFVGLHCGAISDTLLEAELFGHERGAFTGAAQSRPGLIETAERGTLLLDEVGELGAMAQMKLLRVLEERVVLRVGARTPRPVDVRIVAATNRNLEAEIARGTFREDLFYRLNGIALTIPPLRQRPSEVAPLVALFLGYPPEQAHSAVLSMISPEAMDVFARYSWPGNVRELKNVVERATALANGAMIGLDHLPPKLQAMTTSAPPPKNIVSEARDVFEVRSPEDLQAVSEALDKRRILEALDQCGGSQTRAAEVLGIARRTLINRIEEYGLPRPRKKPR